MNRIVGRNAEKENFLLLTIELAAIREKKPLFRNIIFLNLRKNTPNNCMN
ncbi:MAG: hypothetical protein PHE56_03515 [Bacteroidales bacterium]|nr:hypothetical protein [Bacteroidales bacterium]